MHDELQSSPLEIPVPRRLVSYTKETVIENSVIQSTNQVWF